MSATNTKARILQLLAGALMIACIAAAISHYSLLSPEFRLLRFSDFIIDPHTHPPGGGGSLIAFYMMVIVPLAVPIMCAVGLGLLLLSRAGQRRLDGYITIIAMAVIAAWLLDILIMLWARGVFLDAPEILPGVALIIEFTDLLGARHLVSGWVFIVASPFFTLAIAIFLLINKGRQRWPEDGPAARDGHLS